MYYIFFRSTPRETFRYLEPFSFSISGVPVPQLPSWSLPLGHRVSLTERKGLQALCAKQPFMMNQKAGFQSVQCHYLQVDVRDLL